MILLGYDIETTGLDKQNDQIIEMGLVLYSTGLRRVVESTGFLVKPDAPLSADAAKVTGLIEPALEKFGYGAVDALEDFIRFAEQADAIIGHNINRFDKFITENEAKRFGYVLPEKLWIDTMTDIPGVKGEQLITMCAKKGFVYDAHGALADANAVVKLAETYDAESSATSYDKIVERAKSPLVVLRVHQPNTTANNKVVRKLGFIWNAEYKIWWRATKEIDIEGFVPTVPFEVSRVGKEIPLEFLQD
jgi:DNA polymerase III alpha subunit (gram-positive type)